MTSFLQCLVLVLIACGVTAALTRTTILDSRARDDAQDIAEE